LNVHNAAAHGYIVRSTPADRSVLARAPNQVQIWFSEGIERDFSTIEVVNQSGERVDLGDGGVDERNSAKLVVSLPGDLPPGAYLVKMRPVFTSDGHAVSDTLVFWVGEQVGEVDAESAANTALPLEALWRVLVTLSLTVMLGTVAVYVLVMRPAWRNQRWALGGLPPRVMGRLRLLMWLSLIVGNVVNGFALLQVSMTLFETDVATVFRDELWNIVLVGTNFGDVWRFRAILLMVMLFVQIVGAQQAQNRPESTHILWLVNGGLAALTLSTMSFISHAAGSPVWSGASVLVDYVHLLAVAVWIGGLIAIALVIRPALAPLEPESRGVALFVLLKRFSGLAVFALSLIIATGIFNALIHVPRASDLSSSTYGLTLLSKILLMTPLLVLGALHHVAVNPQRFESLAARRFVRLPASLRLEVFFALAVIFVAGWLPATPPPIPSESRGQVEAPIQTLTVEDYDVELTINPGAVGSNAYDVRITQTGQAVDAEAVRLRFSLPEAGLYSAPLIMDETEPGLWVSASGDVDRVATWDVYVDFDAAQPFRAAFQWPIVAEVQDQNARSAGILNWISAASIIAVVLFWAGPRAFALRSRLDITPANLAIAVTASALTIAVSVAGFLLVRDTGRAVREQRDPPPALINPIFADQEQLAIGRDIYEANCLLCHGADGSGARPMTANLAERTPPLSAVLAERQDEDLFRILEGGLVNRHSFGTDLSPENRWRLLGFLRSLE
jgi:copper transport protein